MQGFGAEKFSHLAERLLGRALVLRGLSLLLLPILPLLGSVVCFFFRLETSVSWVTKLFRQTHRSSDWRRAPSFLQPSFSSTCLHFSPSLHRSIHD